jgi:NADPH-dependent 2,4-dienoyl-CoA reductase/sulfur reductase-like enzyme
MGQHFDFVLLGGGPASLSAAETLRAEGAKGSILMIAGEDCVPYGHSALSIEHLLTTQNRVQVHFTEGQKERIAESIAETREALKAFEQEKKPPEGG